MTARWVVWTGRVISVLGAALFIFSAGMKFAGGEQVMQGFAHLELAESSAVPLGILEMACAILYLIPWTSVLGAILLTGYLGGAILTHARVGDPFVMQVVLGVLVWLGLWLRDERLRALIPLKKI